MGIFGGGGGGGGGGGETTAATVQPVKPVPPPAQMSASLQAVRGQKNEAAAIGGMGGTILTSGQGVDIPNANTERSAAAVLYGKKLTGA